MRAYYSDTFVLPLPAGHRFPMEKYARLRERALAEEVLRPEDLREAPAAPWQDLALVHTRSYLAAVEHGTLSDREQRRLGFPWTSEMVERSRRSVGATIAAARTAISERERGGWGVAVNLAGGTHHAHADRGEGFCVFNDVAVAIRVLQRDRRIATAAVVDCDVHQGDGTAAIFAGDESVLTFSIHGAANYPFRRERSTIDVDLPDGTGDAAYLDALRAHLPRILADFRPDVVFYLAGADPFEGDRLGRLSVTRDGLERRDRLVLDACRSRGVPVTITMAGGYGIDVADTVDIHLGTIRTVVGLRRERLETPPPNAARRR